MATTDYMTVDNLKDLLRIDATNTRFDYALGIAISSASRQIDEHCHERFWLDDDPTPRLFEAHDPYRLSLPAFASTTGLVVEIDRDGDGVYETTWTAGTDYRATPYNPEPGFPYRGIQAFRAAFPTITPYGIDYPYTSFALYGPGAWSDQPRVQVTARWGWPEVPDQVIQACSILATDHYKSKDVTDGASGPQGLSTGRFGSHPSLKSPGFNAQAAKLLCGLREPVIA